MAEVLEYPFERNQHNVGPCVGLGPQPEAAGTSEAGRLPLAQQRVGFKRGRAPLQAHSANPHHGAHHHSFKRGRVSHHDDLEGSQDHQHHHHHHHHHHHDLGSLAQGLGGAKASHQGDQDHGGFQKENHILKKAVAIQNEKLRTEKETSQQVRQLLVEAQQQVRDLLRQKEENHHLRQALAQSQEQCRHLEIENYSLRVHLRQMNNSGTPLGGDHRPNRDIF